MLRCLLLLFVHPMGPNDSTNFIAMLWYPLLSWIKFRWVSPHISIPDPDAGIRHSNGILPFNPSIPQALRGQHVSSGREAAGGQKMTTEPGVEREEAEWETFFRAAANV
jgi:hypothetical protein